MTPKEPKPSSLYQILVAYGLYGLLRTEEAESQIKELMRSKVNEVGRCSNHCNCGEEIILKVEQL